MTGTRYSPNTCLRLALERGITVDEEDVWLLQQHTWAIDHYGYACTTYNKRKLKLHHCIMGVPIWKGECVDHIDRNPRNNRRNNLRYTDQQGNAMNASYVLNSSNIYRTWNGLYSFQVMRHGVMHRKAFTTEAKAIAARDEWFAMQGEQR